MSSRHYAKAQHVAPSDPTVASVQPESWQHQHDRSAISAPTAERAGYARSHGWGQPSPLMQPKLKIGRLNDPSEREADRVAEHMATRSQEAKPEPVSAPKTRDRRSIPADTPAPVRDASRSPSRPLDAATRAAIEPQLGYDFSHVRIHNNQASARSARALHARAYTIGNDIVFGQGEFSPDTPSGQKLLTHELTHVVQQNDMPAQQGVVQRAGFFEAIKRFFGGGTFSSDELEVYLLTLETSDGIEGDNDSDNKARAVVKREMHKGLDLTIRIKLIREMLSGVTGNDDEEAILKIIQDATPVEREIIIERIGIDVLESNFQGDQFDTLQGLIARSARAYKQQLSTDWFVSYSARGAVEARTKPPGLVIDQLDVEPAGARQVKTIAKDKSFYNVTGAPQPLESTVEHPRDAGGRGFLAFRLAPVTEDGTVGPPATAVPETINQPYNPLTFDRSRVDLNLDITYGTEQRGTQTTSKSTEQETGTTETQGSKDISGTATTTGTKTGSSTGVSLGAETARGESQAETTGQSTSATKGSSSSSTTGRSTAETTGSSSSTTKGSSTTKTEGSSSSTTKGSSTTKTEGTETTFNFQAEGTLDADLGKLVEGLSGKLVSGGILGKLLEKAGPTGRRLLGVLGKLRKLNAFGLVLDVIGDSFKLSGTLTGDIARTYIDTTSKTTSSSTTNSKSSSNAATTSRSNADTTSRSRTEEESTSKTQTDSESKTQTDSKSNTQTQSGEVRARVGVDRTTSSEKSESTTISSGTEKSRATTDVDLTREQTGTSTTEFRLVPVIKNATLRFEVKK